MNSRSPAHDPEPEPPHPDPPAVRARLAASHQGFLAFVQGRVASRALAESILRDAFGTTDDGPESVDGDESAVAWFVRRLRTAVLAYQGLHGVTSRGLEALAADLEETSAGAFEARRVIQDSIERLTDNLDPAYASTLQRIEVDGMAASKGASEAGLKNPNTLVVRLYLAREALKKQIILACMHCAE